MVTISPEAWDLIKLFGSAYLVFVLNRSDRNQRELFHRMNNLEITCAGHHGDKPKVKKVATA